MIGELALLCAVLFSIYLMLKPPKDPNHLELLASLQEAIDRETSDTLATPHEMYAYIDYQASVQSEQKLNEERAREDKIFGNYCRIRGASLF